MKEWKKLWIIILFVWLIIHFAYSITPAYNLCRIYACDKIEKEWKVFYDKKTGKAYIGLVLRWTEKFF